MGYLTSYGTQWGNIPMTAGQLFWVAPAASYTVGGRAYSASDGNDGLSPERALLTLARAVALSTAGAGDAILMLPGAHSYSASVAVSKAGLSIVGLPYYPGAANHFSRPMATVTTTADDEVMNVTAADVEIANLRVIPVTTKTGIDFTTAAHRLWLHDVSFDMATPAVNTGTKGVAATTSAQAPTLMLFERLYADSDGAQGAAVELGAAVGAIVQDCVVGNSAGTWAAGMNVLGAAANQCIFRRNLFFCNGTAMTVGIEGADLTTGSSVFISDNRFGSLVTKGVDTFGAADAEISENYDFGVGSADGGVLVTAIT